jgi:hypothetical protein
VLVGVRQAPDLRRGVGWVADADEVRLLGEAADQGVVDGALREDCRGGGAPLPAQRERAEQRAVDGLVQVGVGEDDAGGVAEDLG